MDMKPIAHIRTDLPQKFGIPRNSFLAPHLQGQIVFESEFALEAAVAGLEGFSHLWLIWQFENGLPGGTACDIESDAGAPKAQVASMEKAPAAGATAYGNGNASGAGATTVTDRNASGSGATAVADRNASGAAGYGAPAQAAIIAHDTSAHSKAEATMQAADQQKQRDAQWSPTVRPPRLGGVERVGVFATRSPFRPNPLGLTCVKLERIEHTENGPIIHILGADLRNNTPIFDIKPYIPFADCHPEATGGFIDETPWNELDVVLPDELREKVPEEKQAGLIEVLRQDPRRAGSKHEPTRIYHLAYAGLDVSFTVDRETLFVVAVDSAAKAATSDFK